MIAMGAIWGRRPSSDGIEWQSVSCPVVRNFRIGPGQGLNDAGQGKRPQQDSNLRTRLRRPMLYPLSYGGSLTEKATSPGPCS